jgi:hypothetical protein
MTAFQLAAVLVVLAADHLLPPTGLVFGRVSAPRSHHLYRSADHLAGMKMSDPARRPEHPDAVVLVKLRGSGQRTMAPPSIHPGGEAVEWATFAHPAVVGGAELTTGVKMFAAAPLLGRHDAAFALAGGLLRAGLSFERVGTDGRTVCAAANDEEAPDRVTH